MTAAELGAYAGTALGSALVALRGRGAWLRLRVRKDGLPRCGVCGHRCTYCRRAAVQVSDPAPKDEDVTPRRRIRPSWR